MDKHAAMQVVWRKIMWIEIAYIIDAKEFISPELGERISKLYFTVYDLYLKKEFGQTQ